MFFRDSAEIYDQMIDWPKRLAREGPFFRAWFERVGASRVVDVACGTGHHAAMFHAWGLRVEGRDASDEMICRARARWGEPPGLVFHVHRFEQPREAEQPFDAAICIGNSLALAGEPVVAEAAVGRMVDAVRPGGVVIVQVLNLWRLTEGPIVWQKSLRARLPGGDAIVLKGVHRCGSAGFVDLAVALWPTEAGPAPIETKSARFLGIEAGWLADAMASHGAAAVECFGDYAQRAYDRAASEDLIVVAVKR